MMIGGETGILTLVRGVMYASARWFGKVKSCPATNAICESPSRESAAGFLLFDASVRIPARSPRSRMS